MKESDSRTFSDAFTLRMPDGMRQRIKVGAARNNRSMNAEIIALLEKEYPDPRTDIRAALARIADLADAIGGSPELRKLAAHVRNEIAKAEDHEIAAMAASYGRSLLGLLEHELHQAINHLPTK
ncbi:Arc family DNA-binding protein [Roseinatronobacter bogoriensis]|uniref:Arc family DNA-binding protein n=1 Tax=Roseinatronobacter bogoriensis subsp. barguzinensis TaxID=441209 RepID=A0A2K8KBB1_9RHOB|nr:MULTISPECIES: Arc family DNA-binding protein [Rhodobaca]ATX66707.1 Arc family DNA-binding protein [Rhodobaca barguzinensis]MBB4207892.1 putative HicB family RNase H-like nuclease [Rhodobaca bogoriensis DSM 18756]TDW32496.1 Arc-like DNA binding dprotein [Rhodobaca barguzinensis]TDY71044.1 Arc-like DNA binding dprotein [Rhodobaca bogoriensis DSM 18756]